MAQKKTQLETVLSLLQRPEGACMVSFIHHNILRYSARMFELREAGWKITDQPCDRTDHSGHVNYRIEPKLSSFAPETLL